MARLHTFMHVPTIYFLPESSKHKVLARLYCLYETTPREKLSLGKEFDPALGEYRCRAGSHQHGPYDRLTIAWSCEVVNGEG